MHANGKCCGAEEESMSSPVCFWCCMYIEQVIQLPRISNSTNVCTEMIYSSTILFSSQNSWLWRVVTLIINILMILILVYFKAFSCWMYAIWGGRQLIRNKLPCKYKDRNYYGWWCEGRFCCMCRWVFVWCFLGLMLLSFGCVLYVTLFPVLWWENTLFIYWLYYSIESWNHFQFVTEIQPLGSKQHSKVEFSI